MNMISKWASLPFSSKYEVSTCGLLRNTRGMILNPYVRGKYLRIKLSVGVERKSFSIHKLVAMTFIKNNHKKPFVNHIDGNPLNNRAENLEWCTASENQQHSRKVSKNGAVLSLKKFRILYKKYHTKTLEDFAKLIEPEFT